MSERVQLGDPLAEAVRIAEAANRSDVTLRVMGGVAIALRCPSAQHGPLRREYHDTDTVGRRGDRHRIGELFAALGYRADESFNLLNGQARLLFHDAAGERHVDVFLDPLDLCHRLHFAERLDLEERTLSPTDLLLSKLQIVETSRKDLTDIAALLLDHAVTADDSGINGAHLGRLAADDWGLWRTMTMVLDRASAFAGELGDERVAAVVPRRAGELTDAIEEAPKSRRWKLRARLGERKRWYELPEEPD
ncbi:MAG: hypothetical protein QOC64_1525 [Solirubrobacteraceae bacterium]|nr:hypothetical protein [Solirubrobacteraceae bacterium]